MSFRVGQKVVCVDITPLRITASGFASDHLEVGCIYTIRWVGECPYAPWRTFGPHVRLHEIVRENDPSNSDWSDMPFLARRFRPVVERKTDISVFTKMLTDKKLGVSA